MEFSDLVTKKNICVITMANYPYLDYTRNCIASLEKLGIYDLIKVYGVDEKTYRTFKKEYKNTELLEHTYGDKFSEIERFPRGIDKRIRNSNTETYFKNLVFLKFEAICHALDNFSYVMLIDGDVVIKNKNFLSFGIGLLEKHEIAIQSDSNGKEDHLPCSGVMMMKSTPTIKQFFDMKSVLHDDDYNKFVGDQDYVNKNYKKLNYSFLPLELYPNGRFYRETNKKLDSYLIHYNWCRENRKCSNMKKDNNWFI